MNFVKSFLLCWDDRMVFILQFADVVCHMDWLVDALHPWDESHLIVMYDLFNILLDTDW